MFGYDIDVVEGCNLRCPSCPRGNTPDADRPRGVMSVDLFTRIVRKIAVETPQVHDLGLFNWSEPLLHPHLPELISIAKSHGMPCWISTNLNIDRRLPDVVAAAPDSIRVSVSGSTQATYGRTHQRGDIATVHANMERLSRLVADAGRRTHVQVLYHRYRDNGGAELEGMRALCDRLGFAFTPVWAYLMPVEKWLDHRAGRITADDARIIDLLAVKPEEACNIAQRQGRTPCELMENRIAINADGSVAQCCGVFDAQHMVAESFLEVTHAEIQRRKRRGSICAACMRQGVHLALAYGGAAEWDAIGEARCQETAESAAASAATGEPAAIPDAEPLVSIGVAVYNGARYLDEALASLRAQDHRNLEIVIADNASTDATPDICARHAAEDPRIRVLRFTEHVGAVQNFNRALEAATADYFMWAAHDDGWDPTYVRRCLQGLRDAPTAGMCCTEITFLDPDGQPRPDWTYANIGTVGMALPDRVREVVSRTGWFAIYGLFRTEVLRRVPYRHTGYGGDVLFHIDLAIDTEFACLPEPLFHYRIPERPKTAEQYMQDFQPAAGPQNPDRPYTGLAAAVLAALREADIDAGDRDRAIEGVIDTLALRNYDWLGRLMRENVPSASAGLPHNQLAEVVVRETPADDMRRFVRGLIDPEPDVRPAAAPSDPAQAARALVFFPHCLYPARTGAHRRVLDMMTALRALGYDVTLVGSAQFSDTPWTGEAIEGLRRDLGVETVVHRPSQQDLAWSAARPGNLGQASTWSGFNPPGLVQAFRDTYRALRPEVVVVTYTIWAELAADPEFSAAVRLLDTTDLASLSGRMREAAWAALQAGPADPRTLSETFYADLALAADPGEYALCEPYDVTIGISAHETRLLAANVRRSATVHIPITAGAGDAGGDHGGQPVFVIGDNPFNVQGAAYYARRVWPALREIAPDVRLRIVGDGCKRLGGVDGADLVGAVEVLDAEYASAPFAVCPLLGGTGMQVKIVEAMAHGIPVVAMRCVAENSPIVHGENGLVAGDAAEFAAHMARLWQDRDLCREMGRRARAAIEAGFSPRMLRERVEAAIETAAARKSQAGSSSGPAVTAPRRIVIDGVIFQLQAERPLGIARLWRQLLPEIARALPEAEITLLRRRGFPCGIEGIAEREVEPYVLGGASHLAADDAMLGAACSDLAADVFVSTYYTRAPGVRNLLLVCDLIPEVTGMDLAQPEWVAKARAIDTAESCVCISHATAADLERIYAVQPDRMAVAHCGLEAGFEPAAAADVDALRDRLGMPGPYVMLVGNRSGYKNALPALTAIAAMPSAARPSVLAVGGGPLTQDELRAAAGADVIAPGYLPDADLRAAYTGAAALLYPSRIEGFGLPVLEAMACGCPVIAVHASSLPEVAGDAAVYVDPASPADIAGAAARVMEPGARAELATAGRYRAARFTWRGMARRFVRALCGDSAATSDDLNSRGEALFASGDAAAAETVFRSAIAMDGACAGAHNNLGVVLWTEGRAGEAIESFRAACAADAGMREAHLNLADALLASGREAEARAALAAAPPAAASPGAAEPVPAASSGASEPVPAASSGASEPVPAASSAVSEPVPAASSAASEPHGPDRANGAEVRVSAIVSTYRSEAFMRGCLEDLVAQTLFQAGEMEIIVIDSASPEGEGAIVGEFLSRYPGIRYERTAEREGIYAAWNRGIRMARGAYVTNANTDDRHRPDALEVLAHALDADPGVDLAYADITITREPNRPFRIDAADIRCRRPDFDPEIMAGGCHMGPQPMWRRSVHDRAGWFNEAYRSAGDYEFWCRMALAHGMQMVRVPETLGQYYLNARGIELGNQEVSAREAAVVKETYRRVVARLACAARPESPVDIVFLTHDRLPYLQRTLDALADATRYPYRITIVDNASEPAFRTWLQQSAAVFEHLVFNDRNEWTAAFQHGIDRVVSDPFIVSDPDILAPNLPGACWLERMLGLHASHPGLGLLALNLDPSNKPAKLPDVYIGEKTVLDSEITLGNVGTVMHCIKRRYFTGPYTMDWEVCDQVRRSGGMVGFARNIVAYHLGWDEDRDFPEYLVEKHRHFQQVFGCDTYRMYTEDTGVLEQMGAGDAGAYYGFDRPEVRELVSREARTVLDIGCAAGNLGARLKQEIGAEVWGVEPVAAAADRAREQLDRVIAGSIEDALPELPDGYFDAIVLADVLEHLVDPQETLVALRRKLSPRGELIASIPNVRHWSVLKDLIEGRWQYADAGILDRTHLRFFTRQSAVEMLRAAGYAVGEMRATMLQGCAVPDAVVRGLSQAGLDTSTLRDGAMHYQYILRATPMRAAGKASIVTLTWNGLDYTRRCLDSVARHTGSEYELIVIDNGSTDGTVEYLRGAAAADPRVRLILNPENRGFAGGCNQGIAAAAGDYVVLLNNDTVVTPGWLDRMIACAETDPSIGIVGPVSNSISGVQMLESVGYDVDTLEGLEAFATSWGARAAGQTAANWRVVGFCMLIKRAVVDRIGGLDLRYGRGNFEDDDFCIRSAIAGYRCAVAVDSFVHHYRSRTFVANNVDMLASLRANFEIFKTRWGLPATCRYGEPYDVGAALQQPYDRTRHYIAPEVGILPERCFAAPDWGLEAAWQPIVARYLRAHPRADGSVLSLYVDGDPQRVYKMVSDFLEQTADNPGDSADIEITSGLPDETTGSVILTGGALDRRLRERFADRCVLQDEWLRAA